MRIYIQTDIEGVAGFCSFEDRNTQTLENLLHRQRMYKLLTGEVKEKNPGIAAGEISLNALRGKLTAV